MHGDWPWRSSALAVPVAPAAAKGPPRIGAAAADDRRCARRSRALPPRERREQRAIASATKLMTALVAIEELPLGTPRARRGIRRRRRPSRASTCGPGERMAVADLLRALLLESANDAAEHARGARVGVGRRVRRAHERARPARWGSTRTRFANPIGLDDPGNHSSALDLARLARRVPANDFLAATVDMPRARLTTGARTRIVVNRNRLVAREPSIDGVKTGPHADRRLRAGGCGDAQGRAARERRAGGAVRGGAGRGHAGAAALRVHAVPARAGRARRRDPRAREGRALRRSRDAARGRRAGCPSRCAAGERVRTVVEAPGTLSGPLAEGARVGTRAGLSRRPAGAQRAARDGARRCRRRVCCAGHRASLLPVVMVAAGVGIWLAVRRRRSGGVEVRRPARAD